MKPSLCPFHTSKPVEKQNQEFNENQFLLNSLVWSEIPHYSLTEKKKKNELKHIQYWREMRWLT